MVHQHSGENRYHSIRYRCHGKKSIQLILPLFIRWTQPFIELQIDSLQNQETLISFQKLSIVVISPPNQYIQKEAPYYNKQKLHKRLYVSDQAVSLEYSPVVST